MGGKSYRLLESLSGGNPQNTARELGLIILQYQFLISLYII